MKTIDAERLAILRAAFERGDSASRASIEARLGIREARDCFARFVGRGVRRAHRLPRWPSRWDPPIPIYDGPDWIGKRAN